MVEKDICTSAQKVQGIPMRIKVSAYDLARVLADLARRSDIITDAPKVITGDEPCEYFILLMFDI